MTRLNDEGTTVFLTTQYLEQADQLADRVGIINGGRIVAKGTPASLKAEVDLEMGFTDRLLTAPISRIAIVLGRLAGAFALGAAVAFGGLSAAIALYTGQASAVQGLFPLIFVILFLSSAFFPINLRLDPPPRSPSTTGPKPGPRSSPWRACSRSWPSSPCGA